MGVFQIMDQSVLEFSSPFPVSADERAEYLAFAKAVAVEAGLATLPYFRKSSDVMGLENKAAEGFDPVTVADREAEAVIRERIKQAYPNHGIYGEEFGLEPGCGLTWVIDPIDGTRAFMSGMLHWGVLLALFDGENPIVGVLYQPYTGELFFGDGLTAGLVRGGKEQSIHTASLSTLATATTCTTGIEWLGQPEQAKYQQLAKAAQLNRIGGDCYLFALVGMGQIHVGLDGSLNPYDIQALIPIIRGAGGVITTWGGGNPSLGGHVVASANEALHEQALEKLR